LKTLFSPESLLPVVDALIDILVLASLYPHPLQPHGVTITALFLTRTAYAPENSQHRPADNAMADKQENVHGDFKFYRYDPSLAANVVFVVLFAAVAIGHAVLLTKRKVWYFIPFVIGCICKSRRSLSLDGLSS
jgi:uncharacterized membrane protein